jgi:hypothetical protein
MFIIFVSYMCLIGACVIDVDDRRLTMFINWGNLRVIWWWGVVNCGDEKW